MRKRGNSFLLCAGLAAILTIPALAKDRAGFEGKWKLDPKASANVGDAPDGLSEDIKVSGNQVTIRSKYMEPRTAVYPLSMVGIMANELKLNTDGSESRNDIGPFAHQSKTTLDGNKMTTDFTAATEKGQVNGKWIRTLSDDGRKMTLEIHTSEPGGATHDANLTFVRK